MIMMCFVYTINTIYYIITMLYRHVDFTFLLDSPMGMYILILHRIIFRLLYYNLFPSLRTAADLKVVKMV